MGGSHFNKTILEESEVKLDSFLSFCYKGLISNMPKKIEIVHVFRNVHCGHKLHYLLLFLSLHLSGGSIAKFWAKEIDLLSRSGIIKLSEKRRYVLVHKKEAVSR